MFGVRSLLVALSFVFVSWVLCVCLVVCRPSCPLRCPVLVLGLIVMERLTLHEKGGISCTRKAVAPLRLAGTPKIMETAIIFNLLQLQCYVTG